MAKGTVAVTGGLGFIGTHLCRALAMRGYEVRCIDRMSGRYAPGSGPAAWAATPSLRAVPVVQADVGGEPLQRLFEGTDAVIHLAALPGVRAAHEDHELQAENVQNSVRVASECARRGLRFVLASTSSVYGDTGGLPSHEAAAPRPLNPYAASKLAAETACLALPRRLEADTVVTRLFTVFGPGQRPDMAFARWIEAIAAGMPVEWCAHRGTRRDFTYIGDAVSGLIAALERGRPGQVYNVAGRGAVPLRHALETIARLLGRPARIRRSGPFARTRRGSPRAVAARPCSSSGTARPSRSSGGSGSSSSTR